MTPPKRPEAEARKRIDADLEAAGWNVQDRDEINLTAGRGIAIREFKMAKGYGFADYLLFVDRKAVGALEAKKAGVPLIGIEEQAKKYSEGLPEVLDAPIRPLPFLYMSTGVETRFTNGLDPEPRSRPLFNIHRPGDPRGAACGRAARQVGQRPGRKSNRARGRGGRREVY
jgi:type I restriction enzyme, R subunit